VQFSDIAENRACKFAEGVSMTGTFHWNAFRSAASGRLYGRGDFWDRDGGMYRGGLENRLCRLGQAPPTVWIAIGKSLNVRIGTSETDERLLGAARPSQGLSGRPLWTWITHWISAAHSMTRRPSVSIATTCGYSSALSGAALTTAIPWWRCPPAGAASSID
jgi:hypothetical protein